MAVASWDKKVRIYQVAQNGDSMGKALYDHNEPVLSARWFLDGSKVVSGGCDNAVRAFDLQSGQSAQIGQHDSAVSVVRAVNIESAGAPIVASGSWDKTLKYWDLRQQQPVTTIQLPERVYTMDSQKNLLVVGTADRKICIIDLSNPGTIFNTLESPLKFQTRCISCYHDGSGYAVGSIEGRCAIQYVDPGQQQNLGFSFKCHREQATAGRTETKIYSVNSICFHPVFGTFATAGSDGTFHIWDKDAKHRLKASSNVGGAISSAEFNHTGTIYGYAVSYDWSKGYQFNTPSYPNQVRLHVVQEDEVKQKNKKVPGR
jgi:mRNA export factor